MMKTLNTPIYAFYHPLPTIGYENKCHYHESHYFKKSCNKAICHYLDTRDSTSTSAVHGLALYSEKPKPLAQAMALILLNFHQKS